MATLQLLRLSLRPPAVATTTNPHPRLLPTPKPLKPLSNPKRPLSISMSLNPSNSPTPAADRLISAVGYCLPLFNGLQYGRFLFAQYPSLTVLLQPILPILSVYHSFPYASFVAFFALYLGVVRNTSFSHYVRFNAMQALVLDVLLVVPVLLQRIFSPGRAGLGFKLMAMGHNAVFVFVVMCFLYSLAFCVLGRTPYLPFVADAAGRQL